MEELDKLILMGDIKTHHNCKVQHEEEGEATGVAQEACDGERQR